MIRNIHHRLIDAPVDEGSKLIDSLASRDDLLWPFERWPPMRFDRPLQTGARGGHGPVRYVVKEYIPGRRILFRFTGPNGFDGTHGFYVEPQNGQTLITHELRMSPRGAARFSWPLFYRWLHDALIEDAFDKAEASVRGVRPEYRKLSTAVRFLRWVARNAARPTGGKRIIESGIES